MIKGPGQRTLLFTTRAYSALGDELGRRLGAESGQVVCRTFPDGERYQRIIATVEDRDVILLGGTITDADTLELYDLACALVKYGARTLRLVIPYYGYATMERAEKSGEVVTAKTRARLLSAIPTPGSGLQIYLLDVHSEGIPHYFEGAVRSVHLYGRPVVVAAARRLAAVHARAPGAGAVGTEEPFVLACTDAGRAKWVQSLANDLGVTASFVFKRRLAGDRTQVTAVSAQVQDQVVIVYDDMIRTGGSLLQAAQAYRDAGARAIAAVTTHGLFPGDALERLKDSGLFFAVVATDSHPRATALLADPRFTGFYQVETVADILAGALA